MEFDMSLCGLKYSDTFQDSSFINIDAKSTINSDITHHSLGPDAIPKRSLVRIYAIFCTIVMHNNTHLACQCNLLYAKSKSCLNTNIFLFGFFISCVVNYVELVVCIYRIEVGLILFHRFCCLLKKMKDPPMSSRELILIFVLSPLSHLL